MPDSPYPWENLQVYFEQLMRQFGISADEAAERITRHCKAGLLEIRSLNAAGASGKFQTAAFNQLRVETSDGLQLAADRFEIRRRPPSSVPGILGPHVPITGALKEQFEARIRELGGAYVISSAGVGFVSPTASEPPKPEKLPGWLAAVDSEIAAMVARDGKFPSLDSLVLVIESMLKTKGIAVPDTRNIERGLNKRRSNWFINQGRKRGV